MHLILFHLQRLLCWKLPIKQMNVYISVYEFHIPVPFQALYPWLIIPGFLRMLMYKYSHDIKGIMDRTQAENDGCQLPRHFTATRGSQLPRGRYEFNQAAEQKKMKLLILRQLLFQNSTPPLGSTLYSCLPILQVAIKEALNREQLLATQCSYAELVYLKDRSDPSMFYNCNCSDSHESTFAASRTRVFQMVASFIT